MRSITARDLGKYLWDHPGNRGLQELREKLVQDGIPLDHTMPVARVEADALEAPNAPEKKMRAWLAQVVTSNQYDLSSSNGFLANAATRYFAAAADGAGEITPASVERALGSEARGLFELMLAGAERKPTARAALAPLPKNALGAGRRSPDAGPLIIPNEVLQRKRSYGMMRMVDLNIFAGLQKDLKARQERRDPARRIAEVMHDPAPVPVVAGIEALKAEAVKTQPLKGMKLLSLQHLYASTQSILDAAVECGIAPSDVTVLGKPYSGAMRTCASMLQAGYQLSVPSLHQSEQTDHEAHMEGLVTEQVARILAEPGSDPILVLDDGGLVAKTIKRKFPNAMKRFRFVEQTQRGANVIQDIGGVDAPVVNVAESEAKKEFESPSIARSVVVETLKTLDGLEQQGATIKKEVTVFGYGAVGGRVAREMKARGYEVHVFDKDPARLAEAEADGLVSHADKGEALSHAHVLISATGRAALSLDDYDAVPESCVMFNAASANNELNATNALVLQMLNGNALTGCVRIGRHGVEVPREIMFGMDTAVVDEDGRLLDMFQGRSVDLGADTSATQIDRVLHTAAGKDIYFAHAGFVINLTDDEDPIPPRYIGLTRSLLFGALLQTASEDRTGLVDVDDAVQKTALDATNAALAETGESLDAPSF